MKDMVPRTLVLACRLRGRGFTPWQWIRRPGRALPTQSGHYLRSRSFARPSSALPADGDSSGTSVDNAASSTARLVLVHRQTDGGHRVGTSSAWFDRDRRHRIRRVVGSQSVGEVLEVPRQAEVAWLDVQQCIPQLPQVQRHRATGEVGPQGIHQTEAVSRCPQRPHRIFFATFGSGPLASSRVVDLESVRLSVQDISPHSVHRHTTKHARMHSVESSLMRDYLD
jgi:hypothetical protein